MQTNLTLFSNCDAEEEKGLRSRQMSAEFVIYRQQPNIVDCKLTLVQSSYDFAIKLIHHNSLIQI